MPGELGGSDKGNNTYTLSYRCTHEIHKRILKVARIICDGLRRECCVLIRLLCYLPIWMQAMLIRTQSTTRSEYVETGDKLEEEPKPLIPTAKRSWGGTISDVIWIQMFPQSERFSINYPPMFSRSLAKIKCFFLNTHTDTDVVLFHFFAYFANQNILN